ncbi:hypothetical protein D6779_04575, partial [Candidatus Parcubacteria bacterium]
MKRALLLILGTLSVAQPVKAASDYGHRDAAKKGWANIYAGYKSYLFLRGTNYDKVGRKYGLDPALLYAITLVESAT